MARFLLLELDFSRISSAFFSAQHAHFSIYIYYCIYVLYIIVGLMIKRQI